MQPKSRFYACSTPATVRFQCATSTGASRSVTQELLKLERLLVPTPFFYSLFCVSLRCEVTRGSDCQYGTQVKGRDGCMRPARKITGWMSNSEHILQQLNKLCTTSGCSSDHRHACLQGGRAAKAAVYPEKLCLAVLRGFARN